MSATASGPSTMPDTTPAEQPPAPVMQQETWAASRANVQFEEKRLMAEHFAEHDFLLPDGANPATTDRENAASGLVSHGTGPNIVVGASLTWIEKHPTGRPLHITWYGPGALVPATLYDFRQRNPNLSVSTHVHLLPGTVDLQLQAQIGAEALDYVEGFKRHFSFMILSGHSFDLELGNVKFHFDREVPIQRACALLKATEKFLFFDSLKFTGEGEVGYSLRELLETSRNVVIYTVASSHSARIEEAFSAHAQQLFVERPPDGGSPQLKSLRLTVVGREDVPTRNLVSKGYLRNP